MTEAPSGIDRTVGLDYYSLLLQNQQGWREARREGLPQAIEVRPFSSWIDSLYKKYLPDFIAPDFPPPLCYCSVLADLPASGQIHSDVIEIPQEVSKEDQFDYLTGLKYLNEFGSELSTARLVENLAKDKTVPKTIRALASINIRFNSHFTYNEEIRVIKEILAPLDKSETEMNNLILKAFLSHDFEGLNEAIRLGKIEDCHGLTDLTTLIGKKINGPPEENIEISEKKDNLTEETDNKEQGLLTKYLEKFYKLVAGPAGSLTVPGVISYTSIPYLGAAVLEAMVLIASREVGYAYGAVLLFALQAISLHSLIHEGAHYYSGSAEYGGFKKRRIVGILGDLNNFFDNFKARTIT